MSIPLVSALLCQNCHTVVESTTDVCPVCNGKNGLIALSRLLGEIKGPEAILTPNSPSNGLETPANSTPEHDDIRVLCPCCKADITECGPTAVQKHLCGECCIGDWG